MLLYYLGDVIVERHAVCGAANLMEMQELNGRFIEERGVAPLVALAKSQDANSRGEACRCLANLTVNPDVHQVLIHEGALESLVSSLGNHELNCQRYASLALANLATTVAAQVKIIESGAVRPLINLALNPLHQIEARRYGVLALASKLLVIIHTILFISVLFNIRLDSDNFKPYDYY
jgi:predicted metallopeptidase